ncbi:hypothetical protein NL500_27555, partial [Klebsiella pneumoniae]|nr:hypothetical protein [Klebsiella pneumoniae]
KPSVSFDDLLSYLSNLFLGKNDFYFQISNLNYGHIRGRLISPCKFRKMAPLVHIEVIFN